MRRRVIVKIMVATVLAAVVVTACGAGVDTDDAAQVVVPERKDGLLYLGTQTSITAVTPKNGAIRFAARGAVPTRRWSELFITELGDGTTFLHTLDARTGARIETRELTGALQVRTVSDDGAVVALMPVQPGVADAYRAVPRSTTELVIVRRGVDEPEHLVIPGNIEPEAFSLSGTTLFVIEYLPAEAPVSYRVAALDLATGTVGEVRSYDDQLQEPMSGTARARVLAPDGRRLYTLYTRDATDAHHAESFVHVLDLESERAMCVDLPPEFAADARGALAIAPSGARLYAITPTGPMIAEIDTEALELSRTATLPSTLLAEAQSIRATVTDVDTLHLAVGTQVITVDLRTLAVTGDGWQAPGVVTGLEPSNDPDLLYVSLADGLLAVDPRTGDVRRRFPVATEGPIDHVAPALRPIVPEPDVQCAC